MTVEILSMGMTTSVGLTAQQSYAAVRAHISQFAQSPFRSNQLEPITAALLHDKYLKPINPMVGLYPEISLYCKRLFRLLGMSINDCCGNYPLKQPIAIFVGLPEFLRRSDPNIENDFLNLLILQTGKKISLSESRCIFGGRECGIKVISAATEYTRKNPGSTCIVSAVDTCYNQQLLKELDSQKRISGTYCPDGFIPGEGAGTIVIGTPNASSSGCIIERTSIVHDEGGMTGQQPHKGEVLSNALSELFEDAADTDTVKNVYAGLNGENYFAKDWGVAFLRNRNRFDEDMIIHHPADCIGDTGVAMGMIMVILAAIGIMKKHNGDPIVVWSISDDGFCAALKLVYKNTR